MSFGGPTVLTKYKPQTTIPRCQAEVTRYMGNWPSWGAV